MNRSFVHAGSAPQVIPPAHAGMRMSRHVPMMTTSTGNPGEFQLMTVLSSPAPPVLALHQSGAGAGRDAGGAGISEHLLRAVKRARHEK
jgi:hypothetical protein